MVRAWRGIDGFEGRSSLRSWLYRIANNVCFDMMRSPQRRARPMEMGPATRDGRRRARTTERRARVRPADRRRAGDRARRRSRRRRRSARVDPPRLRRRAAAPARASAFSAHPLRGAAVEGDRGRRAARHERRVGQQRAAAGTGDPRSHGHRAARLHGRSRAPSAPRPLRRRVRALRHPCARRAAPRRRRAVDAAVRLLAAGRSGPRGLVPRRGHRVQGRPLVADLGQRHGRLRQLPPGAGPVCGSRGASR